MEHPEIWYYFCQFVHQDFFIVYDSFSDGISDFAITLQATQREELIEHLKYLIGSGLTEDQLLEEWDKSGAQIAPEGESMRKMLDLFVNILEDAETQ